MLLVGLAVWLLAVAAGLRFLLRYENTPGQRGQTPRAWPAASQLARTGDAPTLVMMVHPHCPCSRASIGELAQLLTDYRGRVNVDVVFVKPADFPGAWEQTDLWQSAAALPGVKLSVDAGGVEARRFGSATSGQSMLYDAAGQLLFSGGITVARGHAGDNAGRSAIFALLTNHQPARNETPVFGCPIFNEPARAQAEETCHGRNQHN